jgi:hypothetical protein
VLFGSYQHRVEEERKENGREGKEREGKEKEGMGRKGKERGKSVRSIFKELLRVAYELGCTRYLCTVLHCTNGCQVSGIDQYTTQGPRK